MPPKTAPDICHAIASPVINNDTRLHTLSHSPYQIDLEALLRAISSRDALILLQDGVIGALTRGGVIERLLTPGAPVYVLRNDVEARGLTEQISPGVTPIDYTEFVRLTVQHAAQLAW